MSITNWVEKINSWWGTIVVILVLLLGISFGRLWGVYSNRPPVQIKESAVASTTNAASSVNFNTTYKYKSQESVAQVGKLASPSTGMYVASKNSTKYHLASCPGAARIKEENKRWFNSKAEAEKAGLTPAANCPGI